MTAETGHCERVGPSCNGVSMKRIPLLVAACTLASTACISMERVPTASEIREWRALEPFVLQPASVTGVYRNIDIDSIVFHYRANVTTEREFWRTVREQAAAAGWQHVDDVESSSTPRKYETFQRLKPKGELFFSGAEELRIAYSLTRVVVAYVQSDQLGDPEPVSQASTGGFADREIWSRFTRLLAGGSRQ